ncbi:MAG TPA: hypothetical protein VMU75_03440 [Acidimicrobiales bacterium]|nr:hypothetical protein [Acidimicrobiales bacterium]
MITTLGRAATAFGRFWWDFLIGDTPEVFVGALALVGIALGLRHDHLADVVLVPVATVLLLALSTYRGRKRH